MPLQGFLLNGPYHRMKVRIPRPEGCRVISIVDRVSGHGYPVTYYPPDEAEYVYALTALPGIYAYDRMSTTEAMLKESRSVDIFFAFLGDLEY